VLITVGIVLHVSACGPLLRIPSLTPEHYWIGTQLTYIYCLIMVITQLTSTWMDSLAESYTLGIGRDPR
jgi:hypothetical protein